MRDKKGLMQNNNRNDYYKVKKNGPQAIFSRNKFAKAFYQEADEARRAS